MKLDGNIVTAALTWMCTNNLLEVTNVLLPELSSYVFGLHLLSFKIIFHIDDHLKILLFDNAKANFDLIQL